MSINVSKSSFLLLSLSNTETTEARLICWSAGDLLRLRPIVRCYLIFPLKNMQDCGAWCPGTVFGNTVTEVTNYVQLETAEVQTLMARASACCCMHARECVATNKAQSALPTGFRFAGLPCAGLSTAAACSQAYTQHRLSRHSRDDLGSSSMRRKAAPINA